MALPPTHPMYYSEFEHAMAIILQFPDHAAKALEPSRDIEDTSPLFQIPILRPPNDYESRIPSNYEYKILPSSSSIRLLRLQLVDLASDNSSFTIFRPPIRCSMITVDLDNTPLYDAVSYTWGDPCTIYTSEDEISPEDAWSSRPFDILVDGRPVSVGSNLYDALLAFRYILSQGQANTDCKHYTGYFWIDALCINQEDPQERSDQVMMMSRIYKQASTVLAWLGGADRLSYDALVSLLAISTLPRDDPAWRKMERLDIFNETTYTQLGTLNIDRTSWLGIYILLNRAWFKRSWIIQEAGLAQNMVFVCGAAQVHFVKLFLAAFILQGTKWISQLVALADPLIQNYRDELLVSSSSQSQAMSQVRLFRPRKSPPTNLDAIFASCFSISCQPLVKLVQLYRSTEVTDPRDKVYAFWGISKEASSQTQHRVKESTQFRVDYSLQPREVFIQTARFLISSSSDLAILSLKEEYPNTPLPSWVPDFSVQSSVGDVAKLDCFSASSSLSSMSPIFLNHDKLRVSGFKVATIRKLLQTTLVLDLPLLAEFLQYMPRSSVIACPQMMDLDAWRGKGDDHSCTEATVLLHDEKQSRFEVLWRTLFLDNFEGTYPAPLTCGKFFRQILDTEIDKYQAHAALDLFNDNISERESVNGISNFDKARLELGILNTAMLSVLGVDLPAGDLTFPHRFCRFESCLALAKCTSKAEIRSYAKNFFDEFMNEDRHSERAYLIIRAAEIARGRALFITQEGHLGRGPTSIQTQDEVWVIAGAKVPFVLRHVGGEEYRLIGEAYVHGIMHGQAVTGKSKAEQKEIILV